jgi:catechol 2,3-dioxygenase-like lactoylglutathione lyase family enzyme
MAGQSRPGKLYPTKEKHMISHIHSTSVYVADQDAALDFYVNSLGWEKALDNPIDEGARFLSVVPPGATTQLVLAPAAWAGGNPASATGQTGITLVTHDIDAAYEAWTARGVRFKEPVAVMPWGQKAAWLYDLDGNEFFLVEE